MGLCLVALLTVTRSSARAEPITLRAAVDAALQHHPILDRAIADADSAAARIDRSRAGWLPHVSANGSIRNDYVDPVDVSESKVAGFGNDTLYTGGITLQQLVTDSGLTRGQVEGARAAAHGARSQIAVDRLDVELGVAQAYLDMLEGKDLLGVSTGAIVLVDEQLSRASALFKATLRPEIDVLSAKTQRAQAELTKLRDESSIAQAGVLLENAIGDKTARSLDVAPLEIRALADEDRPLAELIAVALAARPELSVLRDGVVAAEAKVRIGHARTAPVIGLEAGVYANGGRSEHSPPSAAWVPGVGAYGQLAITWDLYTGGGSSAEIADAEAQVRSARAELDRVEQALGLAVGRAALAVRIARESFTTATAWRQQAERQLELAKGRYQTGVGSFVELNDARTGLVSAQRQEVQARYDLAQSRISLARELGRRPAELARQ